MLPKLHWNPPVLKTHTRGSHNFLTRNFFQKNIHIKFSPPWGLEGLSLIPALGSKNTRQEVGRRVLKWSRGILWLPDSKAKAQEAKHTWAFSINISYCVGVAWHLRNVFIREADTKTKEFWERDNKAERSVTAAEHQKRLTGSSVGWVRPPSLTAWVHSPGLLCGTDMHTRAQNK